MICICRIETGKQYINVCANFCSLPYLLPFLLFIYIECVQFNDGMTTLSSVAVNMLLCQATVVVVTWEPRPPLSSHLWVGQAGMGGALRLEPR